MSSRNLAEQESPIESAFPSEGALDAKCRVLRLDLARRSKVLALAVDLFRDKVVVLPRIPHLRPCAPFVCEEVWIGFSDDLDGLRVVSILLYARRLLRKSSEDHFYFLKVALILAAILEELRLLKRLKCRSPLRLACHLLLYDHHALLNALQ